MPYELLFKEIVSILKNEHRYDIRHTCMEQLLGLTGSIDSVTLLLNQNDLIKVLISFMVDQKDVSRLSCLALINLSSDEVNAKKLLGVDHSISSEQVSDREKIISNSLKHVLYKESELADSCCMLLCNLSRTCLLANHVVNLISDFELIINKLVDAFCDLKYNKKGCNLHYLAPFFSNISQSPSVIEPMCKSIERLISFTEYKDSVIRRGGIVGLLRNFSFRTEKHGWLLSRDGLNILPSLLLPLAGPEEFPESEMDKLPIELQYLPDSKERDPDPDIRRMLLETLLQFCSHSEGRKFMRDQNVYLILRELHKTEKVRQVLLACENVVDILIRTEEEIGVDALNTIEVPDDLQKKFEAMDKDFVEDN